MRPASPVRVCLRVVLGAMLGAGGSAAQAGARPAGQAGAADRVVVLVHSPAGMAARQDGTGLTLNAPQMVDGGIVAIRTGAWVRAVQAGPGTVRLALAPGAHPRLHRMADRIVVDVDGTSAALRPGEFRPTVLDVGENGGSRPASAPGPRASVAEKVVGAGAALPMLPPAAAHASGVAGFQVSGPAAPVRTAVAPAAQEAAARPAAGRVAPATAPSRPAPAAGTVPPATPAIAEASGVAAVTADGGGAPTVSVSLLADDGKQGGPSVLLPAGRLTGAAAFSRGGELHVVLDSPVLLDLSQLKDDPVFGGAAERLLPDASELRLRLPPGTSPRLVRRDNGWQLVLAAGPGTLGVVGAQAHDGVLLLTAGAPGRVVAVEDEATGGRLLVGTQRVAGQRLAAGHRAAEWALLPSWQGVVVQPLADRVVLLGQPAGFELRAAALPALSVQWPNGPAALRPDGTTMTRRFDFSPATPQVLHHRLAEALRDAATTPLAARAAPRLRVAEAMLASGLDAEAAAVLQVAAADDPAVAHDPTWQGLGALAAWLSARVGGAASPATGFDLASLGDSDEATLWRALWTRGDVAEAAASAALRWRLLLDYPTPLRARALPAVAELLGQGGQDAALGELLATPEGAGLDLPRAAVLQRQGKTDESLRILDRVAAGTDRLARSQALELAVEQRLATHRLGPKDAADLLERQLYAWRGDARELRLRMRAAALQAQAGAWRKALALLRDTGRQFAGAEPTVHAAEVSVVSDLLQGGRAARLGALDLVALADEAAPLLGAEGAEAALAPLLADRLLALDLPGRAEPILRRLLDRAGDGPGKPKLGLMLAGLLADNGDAAGALGVLDGSFSSTADSELEARRAVLRARLLAQAGRTEEALAGLAPLTDKPAIELQAAIREGVHDFHGAAQALQVLTASAAFQALTTADRQAVVLRAARDASEAEDGAALQALRSAHAGLFAGSRDAGLFDVLTAAPVQRVADLPRAGRELASLRALPAALRIAARP